MVAPLPVSLNLSRAASSAARRCSSSAVIRASEPMTAPFCWAHRHRDFSSLARVKVPSRQALLVSGGKAPDVLGTGGMTFSDTGALVATTTASFVIRQNGSTQHSIGRHRKDHTDSRPPVARTHALHGSHRSLTNWRHA